MASDRDTLAQIMRDHRSPLPNVGYPGDEYDCCADALLAAGVRPPVRVIETVRALDALQSSAALAAAREHGYPVTPAVIADRFGDVYERDTDNVDEEVHGNLPHAGWWRTGSERDDFDSSNIPLPATVLREPKEGDAR
ncbi:hypothetical protein [Nocardia otitidiscaviarum]|uniref:hypothetical protein n=1 Tax=Nocardia otitidiscaviarum TaxID=1823 RepID=UPI0004A7254E|nr:hypothetical protein [Nocardia otitidiscaviarum]